MNIGQATGASVLSMLVVPAVFLHMQGFRRRKALS